METKLKTTGPQPIKSTTSLGELHSLLPLSGDILSSYGIKYDLSTAPMWESLEETAKRYKLEPARFEELLTELNAAATGTTGEKLSVTSSAAAKGLELLKKEGKEDQGLRIKVVPGGCSGFSYEFTFDKQADGDFILEKDGLTVLVDQTSLDIIKGSTLEYSESLTEAGFKVNNPNAKSGCGCGESFTV